MADQSCLAHEPAAKFRLNTHTQNGAAGCINTHEKIIVTDTALVPAQTLTVAVSSQGQPQERSLMAHRGCPER